MTILKYVNYVMILAFLFSVIVQYNDPDPLVWMLIYGAAMIACILFTLGKLPSFLPIMVGVVALVWMLSLASQVIGKVEVERDQYPLLVSTCIEKLSVGATIKMLVEHGMNIVSGIAQ